MNAVLVSAPTSPGLTLSVRANEIMYLPSISVCILALHHVSSEISAAICQYCWYLSGLEIIDKLVSVYVLLNSTWI